MKKFAFLLFGLVLLLAACGAGGSTESDGGDKGNENKETEKTYKIGVSQYVDHPSLNAATEGFKKAIEDSGLDVEFDSQNAAGDSGVNTTIANNFVGAGVDLIFANATPSAMAAMAATGDIPIVFTSVTDAVGAELVESIEAPGKNVTGTIDLHPETIGKTVAYLKELGVKKVGMVYNSGEQNSVAQVTEAKKVAAEHGLSIVEASASTTAEVKLAAESLVGKADAFYIITDNTVVTALESVIDVAATNKLPLIVGELDSVERGGLAAYGFKYFDIGYEAGEMAVKILKGEATPAETPVQYPQNLKLVVNKKVADSLGIEIKDSWGAEIFE